MGITTEKLKHSKYFRVSPDWEALIDRYLQHLSAKGLREETIRTRRQHLHHLARHFQVHPSRVTLLDLETYCAGQDWNIESRRGRFITFRQFWEWNYRVGELPENITAALPNLRQQNYIARPIPEPEYQAALARADERTKLILRLAGELGLRRAEIAQLHVSRDLTYYGDQLVLVVHGKGGKFRTIPIPRGTLADTLSTMLAQRRDWLFPNSQAPGHVSPSWVGELARKILSPYSLHTLRARFATTVYTHTRDLFGVQDLLGHASPETTRRYVKTDASRLCNLVAVASTDIRVT